MPGRICVDAWSGQPDRLHPVRLRRPMCFRPDLQVNPSKAFQTQLVRSFGPFSVRFLTFANIAFHCPERRKHPLRWCLHTPHQRWVPQLAATASRVSMQIPRDFLSHTDVLLLLLHVAGNLQNTEKKTQFLVNAALPHVSTRYHNGIRLMPIVCRDDCSLIIRHGTELQSNH